MNLPKNCCSCANGVKISINDDILCDENGVVSPDYICSKYSPQSDMTYRLKFKCIECDNFVLGTTTSEISLGLCKLFSVRPFDGTKKNACSKFASKSCANAS